MKPDDRIDRKRREFVQTASKALAASLILPYGVSALGDAVGLDSGRIAQLRNAIKGTVIPRGTSVYEPWRQSMIWNYRKFERYPDIIVQVEDEQDVVATIDFARQNRLQIKTRSGGHCWSGSYLRDSGILLDLSRFQSVDIDPDGRTAIVGAGVLSRNLAYRLGEVGLAFPVAHSGMVPLSGFLLGGGLGWNGNAWGGMSVFNIQALDIVTADGQVRHVNAESHPDLFWAARGAGPGLFFTVTRFYLRCHPLPRAITIDAYILPYSELVSSVELMDELGPEINTAVEMLAVVIPAGEEYSPGNCERVVLLNAKAFANSPAEAKQILAPLRQHQLLTKSLHAEIGRSADFELLFQEEEVGFPQKRGRADNILTNRAVEAASVLERHMPLSPSPSNTPVILYLGDHTYPDAAYSSTGRFYMSAYAQWDDPADDPVNLAWLCNLYDEMEPFASSFYINEFDRESRSDQIHRCFAPENWNRIRELRQTYDPESVYHDFLGSKPI